MSIVESYSKVYDFDASPRRLLPIIKYNGKHKQKIKQIMTINNQ
jgi:hypothetical protein